MPVCSRWGAESRVDNQMSTLLHGHRYRAGAVDREPEAGRQAATVGSGAFAKKVDHALSASHVAVMWSSAASDGTGAATDVFGDSLFEEVIGVAQHVAVDQDYLNAKLALARRADDVVTALQVERRFVLDLEKVGDHRAKRARREAY